MSIICVINYSDQRTMNNTKGIIDVIHVIYSGIRRNEYTSRLDNMETSTIHIHNIVIRQYVNARIKIYLFL